MAQKPAHLTVEHASRFRDTTVVERYHLRPPYPAVIFDILAGLVAGTPRTMLDVGTGTGELARPMAARLDHVDALDVSAPMVARGRTMPGGDHPRLAWHVGRAEDLPTNARYGLVTTGDSLHWMDWDIVMPRFRDVLVPGGVLAIVHRDGEPPPWHDGLTDLIAAGSTYRNYREFDLIALLEGRGLFEQTSSWASEPVTTRQSVTDYVESFHSRSSLSRAAMSATAAAEFDAGVRALVAPWVIDGTLELQTVGSIEWGLPRGA